MVLDEGDSLLHHSRINTPIDVVVTDHSHRAYNTIYENEPIQGRVDIGCQVQMVLDRDADPQYAR